MDGIWQLTGTLPMEWNGMEQKGPLVGAVPLGHRDPPRSCPGHMAIRPPGQFVYIYIIYICVCVWV